MVLLAWLVQGGDVSLLAGWSKRLLAGWSKRLLAGWSKRLLAGWSKGRDVSKQQQLVKLVVKLVVSSSS